MLISQILMSIFGGEAVGEGPVLTWSDHRVCDQAYTYEDKRYTQHLTHIESIAGDHIDFVRYLNILDILYQKTWQENTYKEDAGDEPGPLLCILAPIHPHQQGKGCKIA